MTMKRGIAFFSVLSFVLASLFPVFISAAEYTGFDATFDVYFIPFEGRVVNLYVLSNYCNGRDLVASVFSPLDNGQNAGFMNSIPPSPVKISSLTDNSEIDWNFQKSFTYNFGGNYRVFQGKVVCGGKEVFTTRTVQVNVLASGGICGDGNCDIGEQNSCPGDCQDENSSPPAPGSPRVFSFSLENPIQADNLVELIDVLATWLLNIAIPIAVAMIVYAGVMFLTSRGDTTKVAQAKKILLYAVIGLAIILIGKGFITLIESVLNLGATP